MAIEYLNEIGSTAASFITNLNSYDLIVPLLVYTVLIFVYAVFVWSFYKSVSKRDLFHLEIKDYRHRWQKRIMYIVKYLVFFPILTFLWFTAMSFILFFLSKSYNTETILIISMAMIAATRITAYYNRELSEEIAKILPLAILAIFIVDPTFFSLGLTIQRFEEYLTLAPLLLNYLIFIISLEFVLRVLLVVVRHAKAKLSKSKGYSFRVK